MEQQDRQRVRPAVQLLSKTTADTIRALFPEKRSKESREFTAMADFIESCDATFDVFNSHCREAKGKKFYKAAFGVHYDLQKNALIDFLERVKSLR